MCRLPIATYNVTGIADGIATIGEKRVGMPNVTLVFINDMNGMVSLKDLYMKIRYQYQEEVEIEKPKNVIKKDENATEEKKEPEAAAEAKSEEKPAESEPAEGEKPAETTEGEKPTEPAEGEKPAESAEGEKPAKEEEKKETVMVTKRKIRKISLRVTPIDDRLIIKPLSEEERQKSIALYELVRPAKP